MEDRIELSEEKAADYPLISIITIVYNGAEVVEDTIKSVINQNYPHIEYIIIDGKSTDNTLEIIKKYERHISDWISEKDKGIYDAMNKGIRIAKGSWIIFMNAGDRFYNNLIFDNKLLSLLLTRKFKMIYGNACVIENGRQYFQNQYKRHLDPSKSIIHQSIIYDAEFLKENNFDIQFKIMADYDNLLLLSVRAPQFIEYVNRVICFYDKSGVSSKPLYTYFREYYKIAKNRMSKFNFIFFNMYILPRLFWSFRKII